ncbi:MAG TPA: metallophosphoesterase [Acidimicrobiales bacterium]
MSLRQGSGELLATVATVNDLHFGETVCGLLDGFEVGPVLRFDPGTDPYPTVMNRAAVAEIAAIRPDAVVAKGDLTSAGTAPEFAEFESMYRSEFGERLVVTLGNHDKPAASGGVPDVPAVQVLDVEGATLAVLDTARPGQAGGALSDEQAEELDEVAARADRPVLVFGHHPAGGEDIDRLFGPVAARANCLDAVSTDRLVSVAARRASIVGYFSGHTHRNKVRRFAPTGSFPWVEVACVKDFPGSWAEYRIYEARIEQIHHRITSDPEAMSWSERCRAMFGGRYPAYALGTDGDRCFEIPVCSPEWS